MNTREVTRQYRLNQWTEIIRECRSSGQKIATWCANHNINIKSYYYWLKIVRTATCESFPALGSVSQQIVQVKLPADLTDTGSAVQESSSHIILRVGSVTLELHNGTSTVLIENTLRAISNVQ